MPRVVLIIALLAACACRNAPPPDTSVASATLAVRSGDYAGAVAIVDRALAEPAAGSDAVRAADLRLLKAWALLLQSNPDAAGPLIDHALPADPAFAASRAQQRYLAGYRKLFRDKNGKADRPGAIATLEEAIRLAADANADGTRFDAESLVIQLRGGPREEAEKTLTAARDRAIARGDRYYEASALMALGRFPFEEKRFDEALPYFERVLSFSSIQSSTPYLNALNNAGICYAWLGELDKAIALQQQAIAANEKRGHPRYLEQALGELGNTYVSKGDGKAALPLLARAYQIASDAKFTDDAALWAGNLAAAAIIVGDWDTADKFNERGLALKKETKTGNPVYNTLNRARIAAGRDQPDVARAAFNEALKAPGADPAVKWGAYAGIADLLVAAGRHREAVPYFERALTAIEATQAGVSQTELKLSFLSQLIAFYRNHVDALVAAGDPGGALVVADASRARVLAERANAATSKRAPGGKPGTDGGAAAIDKRATAADFMGAAKQTGATLVSYWLGPSKSYAWVVTPTAIRMVEIAPAGKIAGLASEYRLSIEKSIADPLASAISPGDALTAAVLQPLAALLPANGRVIIVPDGALHQINFEMLPVGTPRHYWIEDATIAVAPSLSLLAARANSAATSATAVLLVGDPVATGAATPALQYASREIDSIAGAFGAREVKTIRGKDASPAAYAASSPERFGVIHFAAHATVNPQSPLDSSVELSPGAGGHKLYARDVANRRIAASLVTISACRSASARAYSGEGLVGFAWAFLRAGAQQVVAGLWDVDDQSTAQLMTSFYRELAAGKEPVMALRAAKLAMIQERRNFAKPYYWAPFQLFMSR